MKKLGSDFSLGEGEEGGNEEGGREKETSSNLCSRSAGSDRTSSDFFSPLVGLYVFFRVSEWLSVRRKRFPALGKV